MGKKTASEKKSPLNNAAVSQPAAKRVPATPTVSASPKPAAKKAPAPKKAAPPASANSSISPDDIALRAYFISEERRAKGLPGDEHQDWLEAERQLSQVSKPAAKARAKKAVGS